MWEKMVSMSPTRAPRRRDAGFTFIEVLIAATLSLIVIGAVFSAYIYMGRNLTRLVNMQEQDVRNRRTMETWGKDVGSATAIVTATDTQFAFRVQSAAGTSDVVNYTYTAGANATGTLVRTYTPAVGVVTTTTLLTKLTAFDFNYYTEPGVATTTITWIKSAQFSYTAQVGVSTTGTLAVYPNVSARIVIRNKALLK